MQRQQVYQLTQMAVASMFILSNPPPYIDADDDLLVAIDLGINKPLQTTLSPGNFTILGESTKIGQ